MFSTSGSAYKEAIPLRSKRCLEKWLKKCPSHGRSLLPQHL
jgi:hypothetical protein